MSEILEDVRELIELGEVGDAVAQVRSFLLGQTAVNPSMVGKVSTLRNSLTVIQGDLNRLRRSEMLGTLSEDEISRKQAQIASRVLDLSSLVEESFSSGDLTLPVNRATSFNFEPDSRGLHEKLWGRGNLQRVAWLEEAIKCSKAVCRVVTPGGLGTGFLVSRNVVLTNNHVIGDASDLPGTRVEFNFQENVTGVLEPIETYKPSADGSMFLTNAKLDFTLFSIQENASQRQLSHWGYLDLVGGRSVSIGEPVSIIQHPKGGPKMIAVTDNEVVNLYDSKVRYVTDTLPGSSGSPVFNEKWEVVALHTGGGNLSSGSSGGILKANEGTLISHILQVSGVAEMLSG